MNRRIDEHDSCSAFLAPVLSQGRADWSVLFRDSGCISRLACIRSLSYDKSDHDSNSRRAPDRNTGALRICASSVNAGCLGRA